MKPLIAVLRRVGVRLVIYLDDILIMNQSKGGLIRDRDSLIHLLHHLGWVINWKKSVTQPNQVIEFLRFELYSREMVVSLPRQKVDKIIQKCRDVLNSDQVTIQELASLVGSLNSTVEAVIPAALYTRELQMHQTKCLLRSQTYNTLIHLPNSCRSEIQWWIQKLKVWNGKQILTTGPQLLLERDASKIGWGLVMPNSESEDGGPWTKQEQEMHINALEMKAAGIAIKSVTRDKQNMHVHLKMDNVTAVTYLNKMGGTHSHTLNQSAKEILEYCMGKQIIITAEYLPGSQNQIADWESRNVKEISINSWRLNPKIFNQINKVMGPIMLDLFADRWSAQVPSYVSWDKDPLAVSTDAFLTNWGKNKKAYAFPHFASLRDVSPKFRGRGRDRDNHTIVANSAVLPIITSDDNSEPSAPTPSERPSNVHDMGDPSNDRDRGIKACGLENFRESHQAQGVSKQASDLLSAAWRDGTKSAYNSCWKHWASWCGQQQVDLFCAPVETIANFLSSLLLNGYEYRSINSYSSAISAFHLEIKGRKVGQLQLIKQIMKGAFNSRPPMPRYQQTWDVDKVLNHLSSLGDNKNLSLKQLSQKTLILMALASAGRVSELQKLDLAFIRRDQNEVICTIAGLTKTMKVGNKPQEMKFPKSDGGNLDVYLRKPRSAT